MFKGSPNSMFQIQMFKLVIWRRAPVHVDTVCSSDTEDEAGIIEETLLQSVTRMSSIGIVNVWLHDYGATRLFAVDIQRYAAQLTSNLTTLWGHTG